MKKVLTAVCIAIIALITLPGCVEKATVTDIATEIGLEGANVNYETPNFITGYDNGILTTISLRRFNGEDVVWFRREHYYSGYPDAIERTEGQIRWETKRITNATWIMAEFKVLNNGTANIAKAYRVMAEKENAFRNDLIGSDYDGI